MASDDDTSTLNITPGDRDAIIRTVVGEAANQPALGQAAVAHVIMNRSIAGNTSPTAIVQAPAQFDAWTRGMAQSVNPNSPQYKAAGQIVDGVLSGDTVDPTNGAMNFLNPDTTMREHGILPKWAQGSGVRIGQHVFLNGRTPSADPAQDAPSAIATAVTTPPQAGQGSVTPGALAFAPTGPAQPAQGQPMPAASPSPASAGRTPPPDVGSMSDADLEAMLTGKPAASSGNVPPGVSFAPPNAVPPAVAPNIAAMSDADLEKLLVGAPATAAGAPKAASAPQPPITADQLASGRDPQTGEVVVGGKPFTSDSSHWSGLVNAANGALQGAGTNLMAGVQALKSKLYDNDPQSVGNLYDQAKSTYQGSRAYYANTNPLTAMATETGGSLATAIPAMVAGGAGLAASGNMLINGARSVPLLARAAPAAEAVGSFLAGNAGAGGKGLTNMLMRGGSLAANGAAQGGTAAAISSGLSDQPFTDQVKQGAEAGGLLGPAIPATAAAFGGAANKLLGAGSVPTEVAQLAKLARDQYGIPIRPGQLAESPGVRFMDSTLARTPGMGYAADTAAQGAAFNKAVAGTIGETASKITPDVMSAAKARIGGVLNDVADKTTIQQDAPFVSDLTKIAGEAQGVLASSELKPLQAQMQNVLSKFSGNGEMAGDAYQALTRTGSPLDRLMSSSDTNLRYYAGQVRNALDDALERSASPDVLAQLQQARGQYKSMKAIEPLIEKSVNGDVSPAGLMQAVRSSYNGMAYGGGGQLGDLARIGQRFLKEPPSSGTAERGGARNLLTQLGALGAAGVGLKEAAPFAAPYVAPQMVLPTLATMAGSYGAGRAASSVLRSPVVANMLINRALGITPQPGATNQLVSGLAARAPQFLAPLYNRLTAPSGPASPQMAGAR